MSRAALDIWLYGTHLASLSEDVRGRMVLTWTDAARDDFGEGSRVLSAKMPIGGRIVPALVRNYIDGLLPEGNARVNAALAAGAPPDDSFALIRAYGRDTPGAAQIVPEGHGDPSRAGHYEPLSLSEVAERVKNADKYSPADPTGATGESSTLPGMVPKIVLHRVRSSGEQGERSAGESGWYACRDGAASTWIVKRAWSPDSGIGDVVDTEVLSLTLARRLGLTSIEAEILELDGVRAIAVSRYDRGLDGRNPRIHQEDLAQAIGLDTRDPNRKFQWGSRMPSLRHAYDVLVEGGGDPAPLLRLATFSHLVGNTDLHAKNISFLRLPDGRVELSPAYDIAMHLHHPRENRRSALDVNGKHAMADIDVADLIAEGVSWGLTERRAGALVLGTARDLAAAIETEAPADHPGVSEEAWRVITERAGAAAGSMPLTPHAATDDGGHGRTRRRGPRPPR